MRKDYHVVPRNDGWAVIASGNDRATACFDTQAEATSFARDKAITNSSELFIHGKNGQIRKRNSYGHDPYPPRG